MSKVSVIVPVYNCEQYITQCVEGIINQTSKEIEILLVNDGSTDKSGEICRSLQEKYDFVKSYSQENSGASMARNNGLEHATGEFIMFVDADDQLSSEIIEKLLNEFDDETDFVCCSYRVLDTQKCEYMFDKRIVATNDLEKEPFYIQLMDYTFGHPASNATAIGVPWGKLFRRSLIDKHHLRFDSSLRRMQDNIFIMEALHVARTVKYIPECLYDYRVEHINSYSSYSYKPDVYIGVLERRDKFYKDNIELVSDRIRDYLFKEHLNYLMMSIHYIAANGEKKDREKVMEIRTLCERPTYVDVLKMKGPSDLPLKQKTQHLMFKFRLYWLLLYSYKIKYQL